MKKDYLYDVTDVMNLTGVKKSTAYDLIRKLNLELESRNKMSVRGKVSKKYFHERFYLEPLAMLKEGVKNEKEDKETK